MSSCSVGTKNHEEVGESIHDTAVVGWWTAKVGPVLRNREAITTIHLQRVQILIGFEAVSKDNNIGFDNASGGSDAFGNNFQGLLVGQGQIAWVQGLEIAAVKYSTLEWN